VNDLPIARVGVLMAIDPLLPSPSPSPSPPTLIEPASPLRPAFRQPPPQRHTARLVAAIVAVAAVVAIGLFVALGGDDQPTASPPTEPPPASVLAATTVAPPPTTPSIDEPGSIWWIVNRQRPLPDRYVPPDLVVPAVPVKPGATNTQLRADVAAAFEAMVADAATAGYQLQLNSAYRSFAEQQVLYDQFVQDYGAEVAAGRAALPGTSEHQTGLAVDVGEVGLPDDQVFGDTAAADWVAANAHRFGFILRYPPDKADITGYTNEPWHLRYVGVELAGQMFANGLTMEEQFGLVPAATGG